MPEGPKISAEVLEKDGFGDEKFFHCFVAEHSDKSLIGFALYNITYSTWEGKQVYMEDLYVQPQHRSKGIGTKVVRSRLISRLFKARTIISAVEGSGETRPWHWMLEMQLFCEFIQY